MSTVSTVGKRVTCELNGSLARITFTHPPLNVFDFEQMDAVRDALGQIDAHREVAAVVISGVDRAFSAGVDVAVHTPEKIKTMFEKFHGLILALTRLSKITIAQVGGACLGGGAELAMVCDMCFTAADAKWGFPEISLGCYPPVACTALAALVGEKRAADLIFTGRTFTGAEAAEWGLANSAHPAADLESVIQGTAGHLTKLSP